MENHDDPAVDPFHQLQTLLLGLEDVDGFLRQLAELAAGVVDPPVSCGINTLFDGRPLTLHASDGLASRLDHTQFDLGDGPCLQSLRTGARVYVSDVATEERWTPYITVARDLGVRSSLSLPLDDLHGHTVGAMNFFASHAADAFDDARQHRCEIFAAQAAGTLQLATQHLDDSDLLEQLQEALASRTVIDQALGIVMSQQACTADVAFAELRRRSSESNHKLRDVAAELVRRTSGQPPTYGPGFQTHREPPDPEV